jgi:hypothetical protein
MATLGKTSAGATTTTSSGNKTVVSAFTADTTGDVDTGYVRVRVDTGTATVRVVIYADSSGSPGALLAETDPITVTNTTSSFQSAAFTGANIITLNNGTTYHIGAAWADPGTNSVIYDRDSTASLRNEQTSDRPDPFGAPSLNSSGPIAAYVDYFAAAGPTNNGGFFAFF